MAKIAKVMASARWSSPDLCHRAAPSHRVRSGRTIGICPPLARLHAVYRILAGWTRRIPGGPTPVFLAGHAAFKAGIWRPGSRPRLGALAAAPMPGLAGADETGVALGAWTAVVIIAVAVLDYARNRGLPGEAAGRPTPAPAPVPEDPPSSSPRTPPPRRHLRA